MLGMCLQEAVAGWGWLHRGWLSLALRRNIVCACVRVRVCKQRNASGHSFITSHTLQCQALRQLKRCLFPG